MIDQFQNCIFCHISVQNAISTLSWFHKCSDTRIEVKLHAILGNYERQTDTNRPTNQPTTDGQTGSKGIFIPFYINVIDRISIFLYLIREIISREILPLCYKEIQLSFEKSFPPNDSTSCYPYTIHLLYIYCFPFGIPSFCYPFAITSRYSRHIHLILKRDSL